MQEGTITDKQLEKLRSRLKAHYGAIAEVARRAEQTQYWVGKMLQGKATKQMKVLKIALEVCAEYDAKEEKDRKEVMAIFAKLKIA